MWLFTISLFVSSLDKSFAVEPYVQHIKNLLNVHYKAILKVWLFNTVLILLLKLCNELATH